MLGYPSVDEVLEARPYSMVSVSPERWQQLTDAHRGGAHRREFHDAWRNGGAFLAARDGLRGRRPLVVEWKGGHRPAGDETAPVDLRIDHVFLVSCKYRSHILHNSSPRQLFEQLLGAGGGGRSADWFSVAAPVEYQRLYASVRAGLPAGTTALPTAVTDLTVEQRRNLGSQLRSGWPQGVQSLVADLHRAVAESSARCWNRAMATAAQREAMLWRLLRIGGAPYFVLGVSPAGPLRLRVATPWDWRQQFRLRDLEVTPQAGGQARVAWRAVVADRHSGTDGAVTGHVEVRWSHGRFAQPPEAKVYLDTPHTSVPGYFALD